MANFGKLPKIVWSGSVNTINIAYPLDEWRSYSEPRAGSVFTQVESGEEDAWVIGTDYILEGVIRWIPNTSTVSGSGWDGSTGWRAFLENARQKYTFRFYPDKNSSTFNTCYLVEPMNGAHDLEPDGTRSVRVKLRASSSFDGY